MGQFRVGDKVKRNTSYNWCLCDLRPCWCRNAVFTVVAVDAKARSQSGTTLEVKRGAKSLRAVDSSYFVAAEKRESK